LSASKPGLQRISSHGSLANFHPAFSLGSRFMQKGENIISVALAAIVLLAIIAVQRRWNPANLKDVADSAEDFILSTAGIGGQVPEIAGYERLKEYSLGAYRAGFYRATPAPSLFAPGRFIIYNRSGKPVMNLETLEGSRDSWSALYDFNGRHGIPVPGSRVRPVYTRDLIGQGAPDIVIGQYSGGSHCCTVATIVELGQDTIVPLGRIDGIDGLPFEGLDVRKLTKGAGWQCVIHRLRATNCGGQSQAVEVPAIYAFTGQRLEDRTVDFGDYFREVLRQDLSKWRQEKNRSMDLLEDVAVDYALTGQKDEGMRFFALNLTQLIPALQNNNVDPNDCLDATESLVDSLPVALP